MKLPAELEFGELLDLLKDPKAAKDYLAKLEALSDEMAMQLTIKGTIDEINTLKSQAEQERMDARRFLADAHEESNRLRVEADRVTHDATEQAAKMARSVAADRAAAQAAQKLEADRLTARDSQLQAQATSLAEAQARVADKERWADQTIADYREKLARLKAFAATV